MRSTELTWKRGLGLLGTLGIAAAAVALTHTSSPNCGYRLLDRWSVPFLVLVGLVGGLGIAMLVVAVLTSENIARQIVRRLLAVGLSVGLTLGAIDVAMRLTDPPRVLQAPFYENHDTLGYFYVPNQRHRVSTPQHSFRDVFVTDKNGVVIRGESNDPQPDATRVMFLGDSFIAALQVAPEANLSVKTVEALEDRTGDAYQGLNLGVNGYSPLLYLLTYRTFAPQLDPHIVVAFVFVGNDFRDSVGLVVGDRLIYDERGEPIAVRPAIDHESDLVWFDPFAGPVPVDEARLRIVSERDWHRGLPGAMRALVAVPICQQLHFRQVSASTPAGAEITDDPTLLPCGDEDGEVMAMCTKYELRNEMAIGEGNNAIYKDTFTEDDLADIELSLAPLRHLKREVDDDGRQLLLVVIPENHQVPGQGEAIKYRRGLEPGEVITSTAPQDLLAEFCERERIDCLDLLPVFQANSDTFIYWADDSHLTPVGHQLVAETIASHLLGVP